MSQQSFIPPLKKFYTDRLNHYRDRMFFAYADDQPQAGQFAYRQFLHYQWLLTEFDVAALINDVNSSHVIPITTTKINRH